MTTTSNELIATTVNRASTEPTMIRNDVWPALVDFSFATHGYPRARAIVTAREVVILVEGGTEIMELYRAPLLDYDGDNRQITATTEDGEIVIRKGTGCGCGSTLKSYRAFRNQQRMATRRSR